jgi:alkylation response protein AidB-like acyl-CoA dehydrogenase
MNARVSIDNFSQHKESSVRMIRDSVEAVFPAKGSMARVRDLRFKSPGFNISTYVDLCNLGWTGIRVSDAAGGSGLGITELVALAEGLGTALVPEPVLEAAALAPLLSGELLAKVLKGELIVAPAWIENASKMVVPSQTSFANGMVNGTKRFVSCGGVDGFLVQTRDGLAFVNRDDPGLTLTEHVTQDGGLIADLVFKNAKGSLIQGSLASSLEELTMSNAGVLLGAMQRMFDITLEYLNTRQQFGRPIGSFQVLQHRMVDLRLQLDLSRAVLAEACSILDKSEVQTARQMAISQTMARLSDASIYTARMCIQLHGGIGMTDECNLGLYARKVLSLYNRFGSASLHRGKYLSLFKLNKTKDIRNESVDESQLPKDYNEWSDESFRIHVKSWIEAHYPSNMRHPLERLHLQDTKAWAGTLANKGWLAPGWPKELGGMGLSPTKQIIMQDVMARHGCTRFADHGVNQLGPLIIRFGTQAQKDYFLPKIMSCEHIWCQGYSEPNSGSDLASLRTHAVLDGDHWVINGQKIWTTLATDANWIYVLVRTDKTVKKQAGISFMLVPMNTPGITVRPILTLGMNPEFCEVFFNDVCVPRDSLVGDVNQGWTMAKALLGFERLFVGAPPQSANALAQLDTLAHELGVQDDPLYMDRYIRLLLDLKDHESLYEIYVDKVRRGEDLGPDVSFLKISQTELYQRITQAAIDISGEYSALRRSPENDISVTPAAFWIQSLVTTIYGGTSEIQRNILAKNVLHLPDAS